MIFRRVFACLCVFCITLSGIAPLASAQNEVAEPLDYLFNLTFDEAGTGSGSYAASAGGGVTENGAVSYVNGKKGKAVNIAANSAANYLTLPDGILKDKTSATYTFWLNSDFDGAGNWAFMTTPESSHVVGTEKYVGMLVNKSTYTVERYNNSGTRLSSVTSNGDYGTWKYVTVTVDGNETNIYVNGIIAATHNQVVDLSGVFTADAKTWIGHANWGAGEGFRGMIDEFRIYGRALNEKEIIALAGDAYQQELENLLSEYNRIDITTNFYDGSNKVFQYNENKFRVDTVVENLKPLNTNIEIIFAGYTDSNEEISGTRRSVRGEVSVKKTKEFTWEGVPDSRAAYYKVTVVENKDTENEKSYDAGRIVKADVEFPDASPEDTYGTTMAAHDPSIFKDPKTGVYYAYNTDAYTGEYINSGGEQLTDTYPMDTFKSTDLIHWERIDNNFRVPQSAIDFGNEIYKPLGSNMNAGVWAPDIFYAEEDAEHPYWLYYSLSTNGSGYDYIRSLIGLMKGESPEGPWTDCGVVISSQEGYVTNAIDSNIYVDTNGDRFFVWGSFQKGIHQVKLTADGKAEGVDYTSISTIHNTSKNVGARLFATPGGIMGPEGAYMINNEDENYRYMFTSYGWLGTNYHIRIARNSLSKTWAAETASSPHHKLLDHQNRKVGTSYGEQKDKSELWGYKMLGSYQLGDGIIYYGNGHNSVFQDTEGSWYLVEHCRKVPEGYAALQVRKMLWTDDGWPVVSPLVYAGEQEQLIPAEMLYGTWDLSSVGQTLHEEGADDVSKFENKQKFDLPMHSSKIIIRPDGTLGDGLGTWSYDGDHTITLSFTEDGDVDKNQYFVSGDTMKLFVMTGYDKDKRESALVMTGTDQNSIAQLAKKNNAAAEETSKTQRIEKVPVVIEKSAGGNPILGFDAGGNILYGGDPAALVDGDTVYMYVGHDTSKNNTSYSMPEWVCYSSKDMKTWKYESVIMSAKDISWRVNDTTAWASQVVKYGDTYYFYYCTTNKNANNYHSIGVATSKSPTGPFEDTGAPLVNGLTQTTENTSDYNDIDPTVWVETVDGVEHRYLAWGNGVYYVCELNEDMVSVKDLNGDGKITAGGDIKTQTINGMPDGLWFTEAPWIYRRMDENGEYTGKYYLFAAFGWREQMGYATADNMYGPWEFQGILMPPTATSNTNHPAVVDFKGKTYFIYHNGALPWGCGYRRSVCVEELKFNRDGLINPIEETSVGIAGTPSLIKLGEGYIYHENFINPNDDASYPLKKSVLAGNGISDILDAQWEIVRGKANADNEYYVSIQSVNKPGLYLAAQSDNSVLLTQDANQNDASMASAMTFKTIKGLNGEENAVSFESVLKPGYFLAALNGKLVLARDNTDLNAVSFDISEYDEDNISGGAAQIEDAWIKNGASVDFRLVNAAVYGEVSAYAAEYKNGVLIGAGALTDIKITAHNQPVSIPYKRIDNTSQIKLFVWSDMKPAADAVSVTSTQSPYTVPEGYTSYFSFDGNLSDSVSGKTGTSVPSKITGNASGAALYDGGYKGQAVKFTGNGSQGIKLGNVITDGKYTVSFIMKANEFTQHTSGIFIDAGSSSNQKWVSAPFGQKTGGGTMVWSYKNDYITLPSTGRLEAGKWHQITITADGTSGTLYIDGAKTGSGTIADITDANTNVYLGVNYWDTPFNGLIDEMYIYNGKTLSGEQVLSMYEATFSDAEVQ